MSDPTLHETQRQRDARHYAAGRAAREAGKNECANPHPACTREHEVWWKGWAGEPLAAACALGA